jgi:hypothetical protein
MHWHVNPDTGKPHMLDSDYYGYPGGMALHKDESIYVVYCKYAKTDYFAKRSR